MHPTGERGGYDASGMEEQLNRGGEGGGEAAYASQREEEHMLLESIGAYASWKGGG